jgi:cytochrome c-type biogenesis protein CcmH/NrfG
MGKKRRRSAEATPAGAPPPAQPAIPGFLVGRPSIPGLLLLLLIMVVIGISGGYIVYRLNGQTVVPASGAPAGDPAAPWRARLLQNPQDIEALLGLAHVNLDQQNLDEAEALYTQVLAKEPKNVEAITHLGTVQLGRGQVEAALARYNQALALDPGYVHALWDKANLLQQVKKDYAGAITVWETFMRAVGPDSQDGKTAQQFIAEARKAMAGGSKS